MKLNLIKVSSLVLGVLAIGIYLGCQPDKFNGEGNGLTPKNLTSTFTVTPLTGKPNYYVLNANQTGVQSIKWDFGDGNGLLAGNFVDTVFYPDAGTYNVTLNALGYVGGITKTSDAQPIAVATTDPKFATFTITPLTGKPNYYILTADPTGVKSVKWDLGDGGGFNPGKLVDTVFYPDAGTYVVKLTATSFVSGPSKTSAPQTIVVATSDPKAGNLVLGGKMGQGDDAYWTHFIVGTGQNMVIDASKGVMVANESGYQAGAVYQTVNLVAGQKYMVDMIVSGSGATDSWFEVWVDTKQPVNGQDYNTGKKPISLNTFAGCGSTAFNGKLSALSCSGDGDPFTVSTTGTYYLVIKCGGSNTGVTGISFTNVTLRGVN